MVASSFLSITSPLMNRRCAVHHRHRGRIGEADAACSSTLVISCYLLFWNLVDSVATGSEFFKDFGISEGKEQAGVSLQRPPARLRTLRFHPRTFGLWVRHPNHEVILPLWQRWIVLKCFYWFFSARRDILSITQKPPSHLPPGTKRSCLSQDRRTSWTVIIKLWIIICKVQWWVPVLCCTTNHFMSYAYSLILGIGHQTEGYEWCLCVCVCLCLHASCFGTKHCRIDLGYWHSQSTPCWDQIAAASALWKPDGIHGE